MCQVFMNFLIPYILHLSSGGKWEVGTAHKSIARLSEMLCPRNNFSLKKKKSRKIKHENMYSNTKMVFHSSK